MSWFIDPEINNGYPWHDQFPVSFQSSWSGELPHSAWRIEGDINSGYPWIWFWFKEESSRSGEMVIGGSQSNYPNGFTYSNRGGVAAQLDNSTMLGHGASAQRALAILNSALDGRQFILSGSELETVLAAMNDPSSGIDADRISKLYGSSVYDAFLVCKVYPFKLEKGSSGNIKIFGTYRLGEATDVYSKAASCMWEHYFGTVELAIAQAWEIEEVDYSIFLPFAGTFPLDVRDGSAIGVKICVDLFHGLGEYTVYQNDQITGIYKCSLGADIPLNLNQGIMHSNLCSNIISTLSSGLPLLGSIAGGAVAGPLGSTIGSAAASMVSGAIQQNAVSHHTVTAPQVGGLTSLYSYPFPRVIAKIPKMFKDGYGYSEIIGESRQSTYTQLKQCSGFTRCKDYKCDIIVATDEEKNEIEQLMAAGVFL